MCEREVETQAMWHVSKLRSAPVLIKERIGNAQCVKNSESRLAGVFVHSGQGKESFPAVKPKSQHERSVLLLSISPLVCLFVYLCACVLL